MAIIKTYRQRHGPTTEARLTAVVQEAREAAMVPPWEWRKSRILLVAGIHPVSRLMPLRLSSPPSYNTPREALMPFTLRPYRHFLVQGAVSYNAG